MKCPRCHLREAIIDDHYGVLYCQPCQDEDAIPLSQRPEFYNRSKQERIQVQREEFAKDLEQPFLGNKPNREFAKAYPDRIKDYYNKDQIKQMDI